MQPLARAGRNLAWKSAGELGARLCFLALFIAAAQLLGENDYGRYNYAASLAALALIGMDLGLNGLMVREISRRPEELGAYAGTLLALKTVLAALVVIGLGLATVQHEDAHLVLAAALAQVLWGYSELGAAGQNARERFDQEAVVKTVSRLIALAAAGGMLWAGLGLWGLMAGLTAANLLAAGLSLRYLRGLAPLSLRINASFLAHLFRGALPLALAGVFILVYSRVDMVLLEALGRGYAEIGWYAAAARVIDALGVLPGLVAGALLPVLASLAGRDHAALVKLQSQGLRLLWLLGLPAATGLWAVRDEVTLLVFGPRFIPAAQALAWLAPALALLYVNYLQLALLTALGRQGLAALATGACLLLNLGFNLWWIPRWGFLGSAAASLLTEAALFVICAVSVARAAGLPWPWREAWRPALATAVMAGALWPLGGQALAVVIPAAAGVYCLAALLLKAVTWNELRTVAGWLRPRGEAAGEGLA